MGKKTKSGGAAPPAAAGEDAALFRQRAAALRASGDGLFAQGKLREALALYDQALTLTPDKCSERALILSNRGACFLKDSRYPEALRECSAALEAEPGYERALLRRARAYEAVGHLEAAAADLDTAVRGGCADALRAQQRVKQALSDAAKPQGPGGAPGGANGRRGGHGHGGAGDAASARNGSAAYGRGGAASGPSSALTPSGGAAYASSSSLGAPRPRAAPAANALAVKVTLDGVTKVIATPLAGGYPELLASVTAAFPPAGGPIALRYADAEGDEVTINSRTDIKMALHTAVQRHVKELEEAAKAAGPGAPKLPPPPGSLPPLALRAYRCAASPLPPRDELPDGGAPEPAEDIVEIDEWMLELSVMFRTRLGIEEGGELDMRAIGVDRCCEVLEEVVGAPEAAPLLEAAAGKFQEAAAAALYNWGNVHTCAARKRLDAAQAAAARAATDALAAAGPEADGTGHAAVQAAVDRAAADGLPLFDEAYAAAQERWTASLSVKSDFFEASLAWGQQAFERAKLLALRAKEAPPRATAAEVDAAFSAAADKFRDTVAMIPPEPEADAAAAAAGDMTQAANVHILWGNVLFERSQVSHARGDAEGVWKALVTAAVEQFKTAGCAAGDITRALEGHPSGAWKSEGVAAAAAGAITAA
jgi:hypothetical protein